MGSNHQTVSLSFWFGKILSFPLSGRVQHWPISRKPQAISLETFKSMINKFLNKDVASSETLRETTCNRHDFTDYKRCRVSGHSKAPNQFLEWFVGFSEGDGSFITTKDTHNGSQNGTMAGRASPKDIKTRLYHQFRIKTSR